MTLDPPPPPTPYRSKAVALVQEQRAWVCGKATMCWTPQSLWTPCLVDSLQLSQEGTVTVPKVEAHLTHGGFGFQTWLCPAPVMTYHGEGWGGLRRWASRDAGDMTRAPGEQLPLCSLISLSFRTCHWVLHTHTMKILREPIPRTLYSGQRQFVSVTGWKNRSVVGWKKSSNSNWHFLTVLLVPHFLIYSMWLSICVMGWRSEILTQVLAESPALTEGLPLRSWVCGLVQLIIASTPGPLQGTSEVHIQ